MKLLFISGCYPLECHSELQKASKVPLQNAPNTFQWAVINGLYENQVDFTVACTPFVPSYPIHYKKLFTPMGKMKYQGRVIGDCLRTNTLLGFKQYSQSSAINKYSRDWCETNSKEDRLVIILYTSLSFIIKPVIKLKKEYSNVIIVPIITDLIDDALNFSSNRSFFKRIMIAKEKRDEKKAYKYVDKFVLLTKAMEDKISEAVGRNIIIEGIYSTNSEVDVNRSSKFLTRSFLYTGSLQKFAGIIELVDAFMKLKNVDCQLIICGSGECEDYVKQKSKVDSRIVFRGVLNRSEVLALQYSSCLLINPRRPDNAITKYSFPSKTMEYLASGTPMIGYKLQGIPAEYYPYYYTIEDLGEEGLYNCMKSCLELDDKVLEEKGAMARNFILKNKNAKIQVENILNFINNRV